MSQSVDGLDEAKILVDEGKIEKVQSTSKAHQATVYKKRGGK